MFIISTYSNYLTVSYREGTNMIEKSVPLELSIVENSNIKLYDDFKKILYNTLYDIKGLAYKNVPTVFILDPAKVDFRFYKNSKDQTPDEALDSIFEEIGKTREQVYFSIQKKSPLFSQFVAIGKHDLDIILDLSKELNINLKGVFPYLGLVTKYVNHFGNLIIVSSYLGNIVLTLSEQNSIYFNNLYGSFRDVANIKKLIENLKLFKNNGKNSEIVSFNFENPEISSKLNLSEVEIPNDFSYSNPIHSLADAALSLYGNELYQLNYNLLNLDTGELDLEKKVKVPVLKYALMVVLSFLIGSGVYYFGFSNPSIIKNVLGSNTEVTSDSNEVEKKEDTEPVTSIINYQNQITIPGTDLPLEVDLSTPQNTLSLPKDKIKVQVLNSTTTTGLASRNAELIKTFGYKNVATGNTSPAVEGTVIKLSTQYFSYKDAILKEFITFNKPKVEQITESSPKFDIIVIIGK